MEALSRALPHRAAVSLGRAAGSLVERFSADHAERARARVQRILGVERARAEGIVRGAYRHFGAAAMEFMRLPIMARHLDELITVRGEENMRAAFDKGRGMIFLSAHVGCWEYGAAMVARLGYPINAIGAEQRDDRITAMIARLRESAGVRPVGKGIDLRAAVACLRRREVLAVLLDQDARDAGEVAPFLGAPASTPTGPLRLARKFGSPVVPVHIVRNADGATMTMTFEPEIEIGDDMNAAAAACNAVISRWIEADPDQWMWMYPRWATTLGDR